MTTSTEKFDMDTIAKTFQEQGYVLLRGVLDEAKVKKLNAAVDDILAQEPEALSYNIYNTVERHPEVASLIDEPTVLPLIVRLLGLNIQLHISHLTVRKPNPNDLATPTSSFINWHQDGPRPMFHAQNGVIGTYYIKTCYILSDMSEPNRGNTKVIPGSHNRPFQPDHTNVDEELPDEVPICGKPGDVFLFAQNLWHSGSPNRSEFTRRQLFLGYSYLWMRPIDYHRASDSLLEGASPIRRQLLGAISDNYFHYYVPADSMLPVKELVASKPAESDDGYGQN
ncbi:phytanoyl-CoA dioxygenase family protein [Paenibacillus sp. HJGM_3]|uniref:phytanoyl-CoA dioxygenase family protein n=1 Tax=Paenibacillus sp. HJGM_3 TaxID=3379816 RepID=UPI00385EA35C